MARQRYKRMAAGQLVREVLWTPVFASDTPAQREAKTRVSSAARRRINKRRAWERLKLLLAANFGGNDIHVVLTYRDDCLPANAAEARKLVKKFWADLRAYLKSRGEELRYVYNIEGRHTKGRLHHHIVVNLQENSLDLLKSLWPYGMVRWGGKIDDYGYTELAQYLTKEARDDGALVGARSWIPSKNLRKPDDPPSEWVPDSVSLQPPVNAHILERETIVNEFGHYEYVEYILPSLPRTRIVRVRKFKT